MPRRRSQKEFLQECVSIHLDKYDYSLVNYCNNITPVKIICKDHGIFEQLPKIHLKGGGCPKCSYASRGEGARLTNEEFLEKANLKHGKKYTYPNLNYKKAYDFIEVTCPIHGVFKQRAYLHLHGSGCQKCYDERRGDACRYEKSDVIKKSKLIHGDIFNYKEFDYLNTSSKIKLTCKEHNFTFYQTIQSHLAGHNGCVRCSSKNSQSENIIEEILKKHNVDFLKNNREILSGKELDFYIPSKSLAIECNGVYWHSEIAGKNRKYHLSKTLNCNSNNIRLIHIFQNEITNSKKIVISRLKTILGIKKKSIYARKCHVKEISSKLKSKFLSKYHLQGDDKSSVKLGLFYRSRLIAVITFCKNRKALGKSHIEGEWELSRYATLAHFNVTGGAGKLLKYFERNWKPKKITTYADRRWSQGNMYKKLGFTKIRESTPNYWYFYQSGLKLYHRFNFRKQELPKKLDTFDENLTEWENMKVNGWNRIWDCGNLVFEKSI